MSNDPKSMAKRLRADLASSGVEVTHSQALETIAHLHGHRDWNTMAATEPPRGPDGPQARVAVPILRMFDVERTEAFYLGFLGFRKVWEHRFADHAPLYAEIERDGVRLHLSEHHGDATPGSAVIVEIADAHALQRELIARDYPYARPGVEPKDWGLTVTVGDPAGNRLVFLQRADNDGDGGRLAVADDPIVHDVVVQVDPDAAYGAFVEGFGQWWDPGKTPDPTGYRGARIGGVGESVDLLHDGATISIGTVTERRPGTRYAQTFSLALDPDHPTTLTVDFEGAAGGGTRVVLRHGGWTEANLAERGRFTEWPDLLERYRSYVER